MKVIGDVPWSKMSYDTDIARAMTDAYTEFNIPHGEPAHYASILGGYWPAYLFSNQEVGQKVAPVSMPIGMGGAGHGGNAHAANSTTSSKANTFARLFRDSLGCQNALFLDGSVSSLYAPELNRGDELEPLGPIVGVVERGNTTQKNQ